jgi:uncharacterized membrane protein
MAFCSNCGSQVAEGVRFCPQCGREVGLTVASPESAGTPPVAQLGATTVAMPMAPNVVGLMCYVLGFVTGIIFLVLEPYNRDPFVRFHAFQSIFFSVATMVASVAIGVIPFVGWMLAPFVMLAILVLWIVLMLKAYQGQRWKLPAIGDLAEQQVGAVK